MGKHRMAYRISVINDFEPFLDIMQTLLQEHGYRLEKPDTGWQLLELFRLDPELAATPVIVCSADIVGLREREEVFKRHDIRALEKPFNLEELLDMLQAMLPDHHG